MLLKTNFKVSSLKYKSEVNDDIFQKCVNLYDQDIDNSYKQILKVWIVNLDHLERASGGCQKESGGKKSSKRKE